MGSRIRVLHVDDDPDFVGVTAEFLSREAPDISVETKTNLDHAYQRLQEGSIECVVSDHNMPEQSGIEFLRRVREDHPDLPFILFTGKGGEEVASAAISAGVTDYIQKQPGADQYTVLTNRIRNAVEKYRSDQELERLTDLFGRAQKIAGIGVWEADLENDEGWWSEEVSRIFGLPPDYTGGIGEGTEYFHPDDRPVIEHAFNQALEDGDPYDLELRLTGADGVDRWIRAIADPVMENGEVARIRGTLQDITDQKKRQDRLTRERDRLETLFQNLPLPVLHAVREDGEPIIRNVNPAFEEVFGFGLEDVRGESIDDFLVPDGLEENTRQLRQAVLETGAMRTEMRRRTQNGSREFQTHIALRREEPDRIEGYAIYTDITEIKERERDLQLFRSLLDQSRDAVFVVDPDTAQILDCNQTICENLGYDRDELLSMSIIDIQTAFEDEADWHEHIAALPEEGRVFFDGVYVRADGSTYPVEVDTGLVTINDERYVLGVGRDLTHRKRHEEELQRQIERLDEFTSVVSHDLRNPLNVATGRLALSAEECESAHLPMVEAALDRMSEIIDDALSLAQQGKDVSETEPIALAEFVEDCWSNVSTGAASMTIVDDIEILGDPGRLRNLFENLFRNALDHGPGDVSVRIGGVDDRGFYVEDDGPGIPVDDRDSVFEPGYSTKDHGTGLGLAIVREIATAHGWDISIGASEVGGARFEVTGVEVL